MQANMLRPVLRTLMIWALVWAVAGALTSPMLARLANAGGGPISHAAIFGMVMGWYGLLTGAIYFVVLAAVRRWRMADVTNRMVAAGLGFAASLLFSLPPILYMTSNRAEGWRAEEGVYMSLMLVLGVVSAVAASRQPAAQTTAPDAG